MSRYVTGRTPDRSDWWQDTFRTDIPSATVHTSNDAHVNTGLVDRSGRPIFRAPERIGFRFGGGGGE